ncbi:polysaccharide biosynthesis/export family protein [Rhizobium tubonense]|uniref:Sugar ABC transporter substrate-binding protein n=1 Tax=Rhizobium tubonense TaxID=484088 RepID=A0A2W4CT41_9HYPH|nr:polysaccharide biosynthesis/export family protein [Rhizobium tubonense]PZM15562.1 sugar ABC transporter substrate-binding protein [Rhizobium tubonense]
MITSIAGKNTFLVAFLLLLSGCTSLPRSGPDGQVVESKAAITVAKEDRKVGIDYALLDLNENTLGYFEAPGSVSLRSSFGGRRGSPHDVPLGYGDVVQVAIFEAQSGGLFIPTDAGSRPGNYVTLPNQTIDRGGTISIPYAGQIRAVGRTKEQVESDIVEKLKNRAIEPQVVVTTVTSRSSQIAVLGDVKNPAKFELTAAGERVLDAISQAGGLSAAGLETNITLQRQNKTATVGYRAILDNPAENIFLSPGDTVIADHVRRTYTVFGASGLNGQFDFADTNLTLSDALAKAGGLLDSKANPAQVFVYRTVGRQSLQRMGVNVSSFKGQVIPVVFRANLRDPAGLFTAQKFAMQDKDVLYVSNASSVELVKFLDIASTVTSSASQANNAVK